MFKGLNVREKSLFMLGVYSFNMILKYLQDGNYHNIYSKNLLTLCSPVRHRQYGFTFNHDYTVTDETITNYETVVERFKLKIANFEAMLESERTTLFITFTNDPIKLEINGMLAWLSEHKKTYHLLIFTPIPFVADLPNCSFVHIKPLGPYWETPIHERVSLYRMTYNSFIESLSKIGIVHDFPATLEETYYGMTYLRKIEPVSQCL